MSPDIKIIDRSNRQTALIETVQFALEKAGVNIDPRMIRRAQSHTKHLCLTKSNKVKQKDIVFTTCIDALLRYKDNGEVMLQSYVALLVSVCKECGMLYYKDLDGDMPPFRPFQNTKNIFNQINHTPKTITTN